MKSKYNDLFKKINYEFKNHDIIDNVFLHPSFSKNIEYDRLEFLGDGILNLITRNFLYRNFKKEETGSLVLRFIHITKTDSLASIGYDLSLNELLNNTGPISNSVIADTLESLIGAIFIDSGYISAKKFIENNIIKKLLTDPEKNSKNLIQEWAQKNSSSMPIYSFFGTHRNFYSKLEIIGKKNKKIVSTGYGKSKKEASIDAAEKLWKKIK